MIFVLSETGTFSEGALGICWIIVFALGKGGGNGMPETYGGAGVRSEPFNVSDNWPFGGRTVGNWPQAEVAKVVADVPKSQVVVGNWPGGTSGKAQGSVDICASCDMLTLTRWAYVLGARPASAVLHFGAKH